MSDPNLHKTWAVPCLSCHVISSQAHCFCRGFGIPRGYAFKWRPPLVTGNPPEMTWFHPLGKTDPLSQTSNKKSPAAASARTPLATLRTGLHPGASRRRRAPRGPSPSAALRPFRRPRRRRWTASLARSSFKLKNRHGAAPTGRSGTWRQVVCLIVVLFSAAGV